eukprot:TRINITY_DN2512_c0_g1_i1.p1 TRINITY_DN2512_c0_g1~~TRINITY_DN2512_c0_g1_i1.p1  ORF type:complete len:348 (+),score=70.40 TRINITY_DN2512_c0_g1_i1:882-1925(+)
MFALDTNSSVEHLNEMKILAEKLDVMLVQLLQYLSDRRNAADFPEIFRVMLHRFDTAILKTHQSKFTQFVLFYSCSFQQTYYEGFLAHLVGFLNLESPVPMPHRTAAIAYMASFLARAAFLPFEAVCLCLEHMVGSARKYVKDYAPPLPRATAPFRAMMQQNRYFNGSTAAALDVEEHAFFYTVCQAIFYALCFRMDQIMSDPRGLEYLTHYSLESLVESSFNPLRVCLPTVVEQFARLCRHYGVMDLSEIMSANAHLSIPSRTSRGNPNKLPAFFPFDPFILRHSVRYITPLYIQWKSPDEIDAEQGATDGEDNDTDGDSEGSSTDHSDSLPEAMELSTSFGGMSL